MQAQFKCQDDIAHHRIAPARVYLDLDSRMRSPFVSVRYEVTVLSIQVGFTTLLRS